MTLATEFAVLVDHGRQLGLWIIASSIAANHPFALQKPFGCEQLPEKCPFVCLIGFSHCTTQWPEDVLCATVLESSPLTLLGKPL